MSEFSLEHIHAVNKLMLRKIRQVCDQYGIVFYMDGGGLIGAAREKDLIPWDDDVDIVMAREEYEKLRAVPAEAWGPELKLVESRDLTDGKEWLDFIPRLLYMQEEFPVKTFDKLSAVHPEYAKRIGTDIFLLDQAYEKPWQQKLLFFRLKVIYGLAMGHRGHLDLGEYEGMYRLFVGALATLGKLFKLSTLEKWQDKVATSAPKNSKNLYYSNYPIRIMEIYLEKEWFEGRIELPLGEDWVYAPTGYHQVLTSQFGDYMTPPPSEERKPQHV